MPTNKKAPVKKVNTRTKSRVGSSSLAKSSKSSLFTKRNGLIVAALATVAGLALVAFSFASGVPPYQYSYNENCVPNATTNPSGPNQKTDAQELQDQKDCYSKSAQAMVYRLYRGIKANNPDPSGYQYWTQQLAGDRVGSQAAAEQIIASNATLKDATNEVFLTALYKNMLFRDPDAKGLENWKKRMTNKQWTKARVAVTFATSKESINRNFQPMIEFWATVPVAKVTQRLRLSSSNAYKT